MGGNALAHVGAERKSAAEFQKLTGEILRQWDDMFGSKASVIPYYRQKPTFGDADILVASDGLNRDMDNYGGKDMPWWFAAVLRHFDVPADSFYMNKPVYGFLYQNLQVDLILIEDDYFQSALNYFAWNDLGNLMGRVAHKMGFKYGEHGLQYVVRTSDTHALATIDVSTDTKQICQFLGYDYWKFHVGFDTLEQMWEFAASSEYFSPVIYQLDNVNSKSRVRDRKRESYTGFLQWISQPMARRAYVWEPKELRKHEHLMRALETFAGFKSDYVYVMKSMALHEMAKRKFNGDLVRQTLGVSGPQLGETMQRLKAEPWTEPSVLVGMSDDMVLHMIRESAKKGQP